MNRTGASAVMTDYASDTVGRHAKGLKGEKRGMIKIFIGAILALLDITVTNGSMRFGILPDFIGCFLLYLGFKIKGLAGMILAVPIGLFIASLYRFGAFKGMTDSARMLAEEISRFRGK